MSCAKNVPSRGSAPIDVPFPHSESGFWAVTRNEDIRYVSRNSEIFSSANGVSLEPFPLEVATLTSFFLAMDPPRQTTFRRLVSAAFTPRQITRIQSQIEANAEEIVDRFAAALASGDDTDDGVDDEVDFVSGCAAALPMRTAWEMLGVPPHERDRVARATEAIFGSSDPEYNQGQDPTSFFLEQVAYLHGLGAELARQRRCEPTADLITGVVQAEIDGQRLSDEQVGAFLVLLSTAGHDTTKQTATHAIKALADHPEQKRWLMADFDGRIGTAVDEFVRYASPVIQFTRTAMVDTVPGGRQIAAGEKVALFYRSGNRDERAFVEPAELRLDRTPNPHVGFGGGGVHHCLGAHVAKAQLTELLRHVLHRLPRLRVGEPAYLQSHFINGIKRLPVRAGVAVTWRGTRCRNDPGRLFWRPGMRGPRVRSPRTNMLGKAFSPT
ncbi:cytochrome P450 [Microtetraspora glauca]|uniref:Cytochrome P450 n=1 Tax=Microtetraspora glauca TaxID=1996 RepID=A0ABV3GRM0_MICGL